MLNSFSGNVDVFFFYIVSGSQIWIIPLSNKQVLDIPLVILLRLYCTIIIIMIKKFNGLKQQRLTCCPPVHTEIVFHISYILESDWRQSPHLGCILVSGNKGKREIKEIWDSSHFFSRIGNITSAQFYWAKHVIWISLMSRDWGRIIIQAEMVNI